jgi:hypothetical protein
LRARAEIDQSDAPPAGLITAKNGATGQAGTGLAIIDTIPSCVLIPAKRGWGGARNRAERVSSQLTLRQCQELIAAAGHADRLGLPFNRHWTVHYERAGIDGANATTFIGRLTKLVREYSRRRGGGFAAIWVREGGKSKGGHVHILMHFPAALCLKGRTRRWIRYAGGTCRRGVSCIRAVAGRIASAESGGEHYAHNLRAVREYLLKGASAEACEALRLERGPIDQGWIIGKRCGTSQNLGASARK